MDNSVNESEDESPKELIENGDSEKTNLELNPNQETMEVHHHSHGEHGKKTWKSYIFEFFMLFFAVFCGSLAEYQLEHKIENDREKQFIKSLVGDIKKDTASYRWATSAIPKFMNSCLRLGGLLSKYPTTEDSLIQIIALNYELKNSYRTTGIKDGTISQLKNSGGFRLIKNQKVVDYITGYYVNNDEVDRVKNSIYESKETVRNLSGKIFNYLALPLPKNENPSHLEFQNIIDKNKNAVFYNQDKNLLIELSNSYETHFSNHYYYNYLLEDQKMRAEELLKVIKEEYEIE
jgi:hypothetical protein